MKLFLVSRTDKWGYDDYDAFVAAAPDEETVRWMNPSDFYNDEVLTEEIWPKNGCWVRDPKKLLNIQYLGEAREGMPQGIVLASFNAG